jgi:TolB-like protein
MNILFSLCLAVTTASPMMTVESAKSIPGGTAGTTAHLTQETAPVLFTVTGPTYVIAKIRAPKETPKSKPQRVVILRDNQFQSSYSLAMVGRRVAPKGYSYGGEIGLEIPAGAHTYSIQSEGVSVAVILSTAKNLPRRLANKVSEKDLGITSPVRKVSVATPTPPAPKAARAPAPPAPMLNKKVEPTEQKRILIMDVAAVGIDPSLAKQVTSAIAETMSGRTGIEAVTTDELTNIADTEAIKQSTGCDADTACMAEVSSWANAELVVNGTIGQVGDAVTLTLTLVDSKKASVENRVSRAVVVEADDILTITKQLVEELFGWEGAGNKITYRIAEGKAVSFAVFDLSTAGLSEDAARNLTQVLSVELKRIQGASVIGKEDIAAMLNLEGQKQVLGCESDTSCLAEIGGALGVDKLVVGQVGKLADNFIISLRLISPTTAKVDNRISENFVGTEATLIPAIRTAGRKLLGIASKEPGSLGVSSSEPAAAVFLDGKDQGILPMPPITDLEPGRYNLRVLKEGYFAWNGDVYVNPMDNTAMWIELKAKPEKWYKQWWVWTSVGAVAAGVATTLAITLKATPKNGSGSATINAGP